MAEKKSKTDVTARDKTGRVTNRYCNHCGQRIMNDREMVVIGPFHNDSAATTPRRNTGHAEVSTTGFRISDEESSSIC